MNKSLKHALGTFCTASFLTLASLPAQAQVTEYTATYPTPTSACATFGNLVSCSTAVLDYLASQNYAGYTSPYSITTSQGALIETIVLGTNNGNILNNGDLLPTGSEDAFQTITPQKSYFFTGDTNDPTNNGILLGDTPYSWDVSLGTLVDKLTFDNAFHQMLIGFDMNQPQDSTASLPIWALITVRDANGIQQNIYFETQALDPNNIFKDPTLYQSDKTFNGTGVTTPGADDFALTVGTICVVSDTVSYPATNNGTECPNGGTLVNTNRASNELEFINYLPGLDLLALLAQGYDTISVQVWMGCFNVPGDSTSGPALLNNGSIGPCDTGGFGDIFLLAGAAQTQVPEPGTLALLGIALLGLGYRRYHKR